MSRESRRRKRKERKRRKQAERQARRDLRDQLKVAQEQAAAAQASIAEQMRIDAEERKKQQDLFTTELLKIQDKAAADMQAMQDQQAADERARVERERISASNQAFANRAAAGLQIRPAASTPSAAGTPQFKRRNQQFASRRPAYGGLSTTQSSTINI